MYVGRDKLLDIRVGFVLHCCKGLRGWRQKSMLWKTSTDGREPRYSAGTALNAMKIGKRKQWESVRSAELSTLWKPQRYILVQINPVAWKEDGGVGEGGERGGRSTIVCMVL